jgi:septal ring factor EnvC (AmiA/AmiB activator)
MPPLLDLLKAFLNASLLLLALCLFLGWKMFAAASTVSEQLSQVSDNFTPVHGEIQAVTQERTALTKALESHESPDSTELRFRLARLEQQFGALRQETLALKQLPAQIMATAAEAAAAKLNAGLVQWAPRLSSCKSGDQIDEVAFLE